MLETDTDEQRNCPSCRSTNVAGILWGLPVFDSELQRELDAKRIVLGGCDVSNGDPVWHCNDCGHRWGRLNLPEGSVRIPFPWRSLLILVALFAIAYAIMGVLIGSLYYLRR